MTFEIDSDPEDLPEAQQQQHDRVQLWEQQHETKDQQQQQQQHETNDHQQQQQQLLLSASDTAHDTAGNETAEACRLVFDINSEAEDTPQQQQHNVGHPRQVPAAGYQQDQPTAECRLVFDIDSDPEDTAEHHPLQTQPTMGSEPASSSADRATGLCFQSTVGKLLQSRLHSHHQPHDTPGDRQHTLRAPTPPTAPVAGSLVQLLMAWDESRQGQETDKQDANRQEIQSQGFNSFKTNTGIHLAATQQVFKSVAGNSTACDSCPVIFMEEEEQGTAADYSFPAICAEEEEQAAAAADAEWQEEDKTAPAVHPARLTASGLGHCTPTTAVAPPHASHSMHQSELRTSRISDHIEQPHQQEGSCPVAFDIDSEAEHIDSQEEHQCVADAACAGDAGGASNVNHIAGQDAASMQLPPTLWAESEQLNPQETTDAGKAMWAGHQGASCKPCIVQTTAYRTAL